MKKAPSDKGFHNIGIAAKASVFNGMAILIFLIIAGTLFTQQEKTIINDVISDNFAYIQQSLEQRKTAELNSLSENISFNGKILKEAIAKQIFNLQDITPTLKSFMDIKEITAIMVFDPNGNLPYSAIWREENKIKDGEELPKNYDHSSFTELKFKSEYEGAHVGDLYIYYTTDALIGRIEESKQMTLQEAEGKKRQVEKRISKAMLFQAIGFAIIVLFLIGSTVFLLRVLVTSPLKQISDSLRDIAEGEGDLTRRLEVKRMDEVGTLAYWFNLFVEKLQGIIRDIAGTSKTVNASSTELSNLSNQMASGIKGLFDNSNSVASAAEEMTTNMNSVASAMEEAATNVSIVASSSEEMTSTINEIATNSERARTISQEAVTESQQATTKVEELGQSAREIDQVTEAITEISEQTNLLALNATIEAARAGEAGKGFAVVANEIKELAKQTAEATLDIKEKIQGIQYSTKDTITVIGKITKVITNIDEYVSTIAASIEEQSATTQEIANNVSQVSIGIQEVNENVSQSSVVSGEISKEISNVNVTVDSMSEISDQVNVNATDLSKLSDQLNKLLNIFKI